jgi:CHAD domain-containing protein
MLSSVEAFWLHWHADDAHSPAPVARRARIVGLAASGAPPEAIAAALHLAEAEVAQALDQFARRRLSDFPRPQLSLDEVLSAARVDRAHARRVADLALALFDATRSLHRLPSALRPLLEAGALLHHVGIEVDEARHHVAGRDLLRGMRLRDHTPQQQRIISCLVGYHRKRVRAEDDAVFKALPTARRRQTLALAALLRAADGLDYSQTQSTQLHGLVIAPEAVTLRLSGPEARGDGARARKKADLWREVFHVSLDTVVEPEPPPDVGQVAELALTPESPMADAARRALARHLLRWQANEAGALAGEAPAVKAVRVSARRQREALEVFGAYFKKKPVKRLRRQLREAEDVLGEARDVEALLADVTAYQAEEARRGRTPALQPLIMAWERERRNALETARGWLGGPAAAEVQAALLDFITTPPRRDDEPLRLGAGKVLRAALDDVAHRQAAVTRERPKSYHRLRLAIKRLRYTLEFLDPALGPESESLVADLVRMQDRLGALNDIRLLEKRLAAFLDAWAEQQAKRKAPQLFGAEGILAYTRARRARWEQHLKSLHRAWAPVRAFRLRPRLSALLRGLNPHGSSQGSPEADRRRDSRRKRGR